MVVVKKVFIFLPTIVRRYANIIFIVCASPLGRRWMSIILASQPSL